MSGKGEGTGFDGLLGKAKQLLTEEKIAQVKAAATDERIDAAAEQVKKVTPDKADRVVDAVAEQAKKLNDS